MEIESIILRHTVKLNLQPLESNASPIQQRAGVCTSWHRLGHIQVKT